MGKKMHTEEPIVNYEGTEPVPQPPTNGDAARAKKPPRDKAEAFKRVGNQRVTKAMYAMRRLLPLANRAAYAYTDEQATKIKAVAVELAEEVVKAFSTVETTTAPPESLF